LKRNLVVVTAVGFVWGAIGASPAHAQLTRTEQLFLYLNYYQQQRNAQTIRQDQARQQYSLDRLGQGQAVIARNTAPAESVYSRYMSPGRTSPQAERAPLPPIYSGQAGPNRFLQQGRYFSPPR